MKIVLVSTVFIFIMPISSAFAEVDALKKADIEKRVKNLIKPDVNPKDVGDFAERHTRWKRNPLPGAGKILFEQEKNFSVMKRYRSILDLLEKEPRLKSQLKFPKIRAIEGVGNKTIARYAAHYWKWFKDSFTANDNYIVPVTHRMKWSNWWWHKNCPGIETDNEKLKALIGDAHQLNMLIVLSDFQVRYGNELELQKVLGDYHSEVRARGNDDQFAKLVSWHHYQIGVCLAYPVTRNESKYSFQKGALLK